MLPPIFLLYVLDLSGTASCHPDNLVLILQVSQGTTSYPTCSQQIPGTMSPQLCLCDTAPFQFSFQHQDTAPVQIGSEQHLHLQESSSYKAWTIKWLIHTTCSNACHSWPKVCGCIMHTQVWQELHTLDLSSWSLQDCSKQFLVLVVLKSLLINNLHRLRRNF